MIDKQELKSSRKPRSDPSCVCFLTRRGRAVSRSILKFKHLEEALLLVYYWSARARGGIDLSTKPSCIDPRPGNSILHCVMRIHKSLSHYSHATFFLLQKMSLQILMLPACLGTYVVLHLHVFVFHLYKLAIFLQNVVG
jgi:hypothetical protein